MDEKSTVPAWWLTQLLDVWGPKHPWIGSLSTVFVSSWGNWCTMCSNVISKSWKRDSIVNCLRTTHSWNAGSPPWVWFHLKLLSPGSDWHLPAWVERAPGLFPFEQLHVGSVANMHCLEGKIMSLIPKCTAWKERSWIQSQVRLDLLSTYRLSQAPPYPLHFPSLYNCILFV